MFKVGGQFEGWFITFSSCWTLKLTKQYNIILIYMRCFLFIHHLKHIQTFTGCCSGGAQNRQILCTILNECLQIFLTTQGISLFSLYKFYLSYHINAKRQEATFVLFYYSSNCKDCTHKSILYFSTYIHIDKDTHIIIIIIMIIQFSEY